MVRPLVHFAVTESVILGVRGIVAGYDYPAHVLVLVIVRYGTQPMPTSVDSGGRQYHPVCYLVALIRVDAVLVLYDGLNHNLHFHRVAKVDCLVCANHHAVSNVGHISIG